MKVPSFISDKYPSLMLNKSLNVSSNEDLQVIATSFTILTISLACLTILFDSAIIFRLIYSGRLKKRYSKSNGRRIDLLHSMNTYIHLIGETIIFLLMSSRTLFGDLYLYNKEESSPSWHCRLLNYLMCMFGCGIYGSCFLQALFRYLHTSKSHQRSYRKFSFHFRLIFIHWVVIIILSIPVWFRSTYVSPENFCLTHSNDMYSSVYIPLITFGIPVLGIIIVYFKILMYMKQNWQSRKKLRRMQRDVSAIRRVLLLVTVLFITSSAGVVLWFLMFIQNHMHPLSYRLLNFSIEIGILACSITFLITSPQLRRALQSRNHDPKQQYSNHRTRSALTKSNIKEIKALEDETAL